MTKLLVAIVTNLVVLGLAAAACDRRESIVITPAQSLCFDCDGTGCQPVECAPVEPEEEGIAL